MVTSSRLVGVSEAANSMLAILLLHIIQQLPFELRIASRIKEELLLSHWDSSMPQDQLQIQNRKYHCYGVVINICDQIASKIYFAKHFCVVVLFISEQ